MKLNGYFFDRGEIVYKNKLNRKLKMKDEQYKTAVEIKKEIENISSSLFDLNHTVFTGGLMYIPNNPELIYNIKTALEEELVKLRKKFENL